jgi:hypothetical protein
MGSWRSSEVGGWHRPCILGEMEPVAGWPTDRAGRQAYPYQERLERRVSTPCRAI